ncbi:MAG: cytochrome c oxidase subunit II, partial [Chloroflexi bacterium]|nr:cytochrome c oxidase subunit II [Chloroflexota bacterium]
TTIFAAADTDNRPGEKVHIRVVGHQWWWEFEYPELGVVTANEFHIPTGKTVIFDITSYDVIHSFWVPRLGGKRDAIPGHTNKIWYASDKPGLYYGQCTEYCGDSHANMRLRAIVQTPEEFDAWVKLQKTPPSPSSSDAAVGQGVFRSKCISCHAIEGVSQIQRVSSPDPKKIYGPDLTHVGGRTSIGSGMFENTPKHIADWIRDPQGMKPGNKMVVPAPALTENEIQALAAYLTSLK